MDKKIEALEKRIADLERRLDILTREICPPVTDIRAEVRHLVLTLGPDKAAEEINRRSTLRGY